MRGCEGVLECVDLLEHLGMWVFLNICATVFH